MEPTYMPNAEQAYIEARKLTAYLLDVTHSQGHPKALALVAAGYSVDRPSSLEIALLKHALLPVVESYDDPHGRRFVIDGYLRADEQEIRALHFRSVWEVQPSNRPRLITAYPISYDSTV